MKFLRTTRFDGSDDHVYAVGAPSDEWAVSGAFAFVGLADEAIAGRTKQAFANGFLGLPSFGRSTFACVQDISNDEIDVVTQILAQHFVGHYGAPDVSAALPAACEEINFITGLCEDALINTVFAVQRSLDDGGEIRETFRTVQPPGNEPLHSRIWDVVEDDA